jgi:hypothetical protein
MYSNIFKFIFLIFICLITSPNIYARINYSNYGDAPEFFLGWETSLYFAIATVILFIISWILTEQYKDEHGNINGGCLLGSINLVMVICAICSAYLIIPLLIIYVLSKRDKK